MKVTGHMVRITDEQEAQPTPCYYILYHSVFKDNSITTKLYIKYNGLYVLIKNNKIHYSLLSFLAELIDAFFIIPSIAKTFNFVPQITGLRFFPNPFQGFTKFFKTLF